MRVRVSTSQFTDKQTIKQIILNDNNNYIGKQVTAHSTRGTDSPGRLLTEFGAVFILIVQMMVMISAVASGGSGSAT